MLNYLRVASFFYFKSSLQTYIYIDIATAWNSTPSLISRLSTSTHYNSSDPLDKPDYNTTCSRRMADSPQPHTCRRPSNSPRTPGSGPSPCRKGSRTYSAVAVGLARSSPWMLARCSGIGFARSFRRLRSLAKGSFVLGKGGAAYLGNPIRRRLGLAHRTMSTACLGLRCGWRLRGA
ncbi:hypothetical protein BJX63DRAFT_115180 [Aspergillus granulosus]|uniref:Uncharacterized protein n=1 Tax=Aspergillus granulosus TaxID=176169 RepID=A0ABR4GV67_9EURO